MVSVNPAEAAQVRVRREPSGQRVRRRTERQVLGNPARRAPDAEHGSATDAGVHLQARLADRYSRAHDQDHGDDRHRDERVPGPKAPCAGAVEALHQVVVRVLGLVWHQKRK